MDREQVETAVEETPSEQKNVDGQETAAAEETGAAEVTKETAAPEEAQEHGAPEESEEEPKTVGSVSDDMRRAFQHNLAWVVGLRKGVELLFHYFFVGCVSILALAVAFLIPLTITVSLAAVLGLPGYLVYRLQGAEGPYISVTSVLVTIFWTGYFVTHGWPRLRQALGDFWKRIRPAFSWARQILEGFAEGGEDSAAERANTSSVEKPKT